ncbi:MAG: DUF11 domain-containing protein [Propionibacteriaceae bacterium]|nr:DUF11 domain-containing protein [Propionibacteriaceae bacterium]
MGKQSQIAELSDATRGVTYTLREVGAGTTDLGRYTSRLECRNAANDEVIPTSASGGAYTLTYPAEDVSSVACTFTNLPPATLTVTKELPGSRFAASDQFTVELREGGASGPIVDTPGNETTQGQGSTVTTGTGTTGKFEVKSATQYTITERGEAGVDLTNYTPSITCTDSTGLQTGLPSNALFDPAAGRSLTLEPGAQVNCVIRNSTTGAGIGVGEGLTCEAGYIYAIASTNPSPGGSSGTGALVDSHGYVYKVNTVTGEAVPALYGEFGATAELPNSWPNTPAGTRYSGRINALAVSQGGLYSYYSTQRTSSLEPAGLPVFRQDNKTGVTTRLAVLDIPANLVRNGVAGASSTVRGGINPTDGIYWISSTEGDTVHHFWAYNTLTGKNYGYVGSLSAPGGPSGGNGDLVFDQDGNMLLVSSTAEAGELWRIANLSAALTGAPRNSATSIDAFVDKAKLTDLDTLGQFNGISFDNDGYLYVSFSDASGNSRLQKLDPNTGRAVAAALTISGLSNPGPYSRSAVDLADCNDPGGLRLQKDYPSRVTGTDNVRLEIAKAGISTSLVGGTATTDGPATGLQDKSAGVIVGVPGGTYVLTETAITGKLTDYSTSLTCVDKTHGNADIEVRKVSQGRYELDFPGVGPTDGELLANVVCTYVNTPNGTLELEKRLASDRADDADQFQVRIRAGGQNVETATTSGTGSTVTDGVTRAVRAQTGPDGVLTYTFDEVGWRNGAELASVLEAYPDPTLTCADVAGLQPEEDLPYELTLADFEGIAPVPGARISCVITNNASAARIAVKKLGSARCLAPGADPTPVTYTYQVTSIGQEPLKDVELTDDKGTPVYVSGDSDEDGILTDDETWLYEMRSSLTEPTTNLAKASAVGVDSGNKTSARDTWSVGEPSALSVTKTSSANGATVKAGDELTYTVTVTNTSDDKDATKVALTDTLPPGVGYVPASARKTYWTGSDAPGGTQTGTWTTTLPDFSFQAKSTVQTFSTVGQVPTGAQLTSYSITLKGSSAHQKNDVAVIGYLPGQTPGTTEPGTTGASAVPTAQRWFYLPYQQFGSGGGGTSGAGTWATRTMAATASGAASGLFSLQWWDYQDSPSHNPDNTASGVQVTLNYTYPVPSTERVQVTDAAHAPAELVTAADDITLQPGESMTVTFKVRVDDPLDPAITMLTNTAVAVSEQAADCPGTGEVTDPVEQPSAPGQPIGVEKRGLNCDVGQPVCALPGAEFALYDVDPTMAGATPLAGGISPDPDDGSRLVSIDLGVPGEYWLVETRAPRGFTLLATPIKFRLTADGIVLDAVDSPTVQLKDGNAFVLQVTDTTPAPLPKSGGDGPWPFLLAGLALFVSAGVVHHRSSRFRGHPTRVAS